jgi:tRNA1(Val) A37 N6-methylase TrmN6
VTDRKKMEGSCSTGQSPQWAVVPVEEEESTIRYNNKNTQITVLNRNITVHTLNMKECDNSKWDNEFDRIWRKQLTA